jgi:hypothetical protein
MSEVSAAVAWLERGYDEPGAFRCWDDVWTPRGLFQIKPDHAAGCPCASPRHGGLWTHTDVAAKWRASVR